MDIHVDENKKILFYLEILERLFDLRYGTSCDCEDAVIWSELEEVYYRFGCAVFESIKSSLNHD